MHGPRPGLRKERKLTIYTAEVHVCYVRELHLGDKVTVTFQLLDHDEKRLRAYQEIRHADGWLAATSETLSLHVDMTGPKVAPFPADIAGEGRGDARRPCRLADARARRPLDRHQAQGLKARTHAWRRIAVWQRCNTRRLINLDDS